MLSLICLLLLTSAVCGQQLLQPQLQPLDQQSLLLQQLPVLQDQLLLQQPQQSIPSRSLDQSLLAQQQPLVQQNFGAGQSLLQSLQQQPLIQQPLVQEQPLFQQSLLQDSLSQQQSLLQQPLIQGQSLRPQQSLFQQSLAQQQPLIQQPLLQPQPLLQQPLVQQQPLLQNQLLGSQQSLLQQSLGQQSLGQQSLGQQSLGQRPLLQRPVVQPPPRRESSLGQSLLQSLIQRQPLTPRLPVLPQQSLTRQPLPQRQPFAQQRPLLQIQSNAQQMFQQQPRPTRISQRPPLVQRPLLQLQLQQQFLQEQLQKELQRQQTIRRQQAIQRQQAIRRQQALQRKRDEHQRLSLLLENDLDGGAYYFGYATKDGIRREEESRLTGPNTHEVTGSYSYTAPNGKLVEVEYIADENGYRAYSVPPGRPNFTQPSRRKPSAPVRTVTSRPRINVGRIGLQNFGDRVQESSEDEGVQGTPSRSLTFLSHNIQRTPNFDSFTFTSTPATLLAGLDGGALGSEEDYADLEI